MSDYSKTKIFQETNEAEILFDLDTPILSLAPVNISFLNVYDFIFVYSNKEARRLFENSIPDRLSSFFDPTEKKGIFEQLSTCYNEGLSVTFSENINGAFWDFKARKKGNNIILSAYHKKHLQKNEVYKKWLAERIADTSPNIIYLLDLTTFQVKYINKSVKRILGYSPEEFCTIRDSPLVFSPFEDREAHLSYFSILSYAPDNQICKREIRVRHKNGPDIWLSCSEMVFEKHENQASLIIGVADNITEKKSVENKLKEKDELLKNLLANLPIVITRIGSDGNILESNGNGLLAIDQENSYKGKNVFNDLPELSKHIKKVLKGKKETFIEEKNLPKKKVYFWSTYFFDKDINQALGLSVDITQQKQIEEELKESQLFIQKVTNHSPDVILVLDIEKNVLVYANKDLNETFNLPIPKDELNPLFQKKQYIHPKDIETRKKYFNSFLSLQTGEITECNFRIKDNNSEWRFLNNRATIFKSGRAGNIQQVLIIIRDQTNENIAQLKIKHQSKLLNGILTNLPVLVYKLDKHGIFREVHGSAFKTIGFKNPEKLIGQSAFEIMPQVKDDLQQAICGEIDSFTGTFYNHDKCYYFKSNCFFDHEENMLVVFSNDMTAYHEAEIKISKRNSTLKKLIKKLRMAKNNLSNINLELEQRVAQRTKELQESEERYMLGSKANRDIIWDWNILEDKVLITGNYFDFYKDEEKLSLSIKESLSHIHPGDFHKVFTSLTNAIDQGKIYWDQEYRFQKSDGSYSYIHDNGYIIYNLKREAIRMVGTKADITERKTSEEYLSKFVDELSKKNVTLLKLNETLDNFVHMAAHDLKSPVSNLKLVVELIRTSSDYEKKLKFINTLDLSVNRLDLIINGLIDVIQLQNDKDPEAKSIDIENLFNEISSDYQEHLQELNGVIHVDFSRAPSLSYIEPYVRSILMNLIGNSVKYSSEERPLIINIKTERHGPFFVLRIEDNGIGMDLNKYGKNLFKPFTRFTHKADGKGIGLHLVKYMVERNGGEIRLCSELKIGTVFEIFLREY